MDTKDFSQIRPYNDQELPEVFESLIADSNFAKAVAYIYPDMPAEQLAQGLRSCKSKLEFQKKFCYPLLKKIIDTRTEGLTSTADQADRADACIYISNHRDIILDSAFLCTLLIEQGKDTVEIGIGDNLLIHDWIKKLVRVNKSFIVKRSVTLREKLQTSEQLSNYIHHAIEDKKESVWLAQREGRAKDSDDRTQESVIKMLCMGGEGENPAERLMKLNITPLAISYEYDPCDYLKAKEFQQKRDNPEYKKTAVDDLINMETGLFGYKGRVHFHFAPDINNELKKLTANKRRSEVLAAVATIIDKEIHKNYRLYPANYVAYDLLKGTHEMANHYSGEERESFVKYVDGQIAKIELENKDEDFLREKLLEMYANPLINFLKTQG